MEKKYELLKDDTIWFNGRKLYRIRALKDIPPNIITGMNGGYIESEGNLSHDGTCWVYGDSMVYDRARVTENAIVANSAKVFNDATVYGHAIIEEAEISDNAKVYGYAEVCSGASVYDNASVYDSARIFDNARIYGNARVHGYAIINGNAKIYGFSNIYGVAVVTDNAYITDDAEVYGTSRIHGRAVINRDAVIYNAIIGGRNVVGINGLISDTTHVLNIGPIGSRNSYTTFYKNKYGGISVSCGCFNNTIDKFEEAVRSTHLIENPKHYTMYNTAIELAKMQILNEGIEEKSDKETNNKNGCELL